MKNCLVCREQQCSDLMDFGVQPVCHHFYDGSQAEGTVPLLLGQCEACGLVQLTRPIFPEQIIPRFDWITYNEPEAHLDSMVELLCGLPGVTRRSVICGVTYKEDTTLRRFRERGYVNTWRLHPLDDLGIANPRAGIETIQARIKPDLTSCLRSKYSTPDIVIVRHIIEHTCDPLGFMETWRQLVKPDGYVVFEVPDCKRGFDLLDYTTLWEDHSIYFVKETFIATLRRGGFSLAHFECYRSPYENCLVAVVKPQATEENASLSEEFLQRERTRAIGFAEGYQKRCVELQRMLSDWRSRGKVALFGAGHHSAMFINLMQLSECIDFLVDDHPRKRGLRMPGSRLPIVGSDALIKENVKLCLTSLSAESERKVIENNQEFLKQGGTFASIFPVQQGTLLNFVAGAPDSILD